MSELLFVPEFEQFGPPVPGQGPILSVLRSQGVTYAMRADDDGKPVTYRFTSDGWIMEPITTVIHALILPA